MFSVELRLTKILLNIGELMAEEKETKPGEWCNETVYLSHTLKFLSEMLHRCDSAHISFAKMSHMAKAGHINGKEEFNPLPEKGSKYLWSITQSTPLDKHNYQWTITSL